MSRSLVFCLLLLNATASLALSQDETAELVVKEPKEVFGVSRSYNKAEFSKVWTKISKKAKRVETLSGRVWVREYSVLLWDDIAVEEEPIVAFRPEQAFLCDFASDFVEMRTRQDWYDVVDTKTNFLSNLTLDDRMFLDLQIPDSLKLRDRRIRSIDREARLLKTHILVRLPEKMVRSWPTILDYRLAGWTSSGQWIIPTDMDQWFRILDSFEPFSLTIDDTGGTVVTFYQKNAVTKCIWQMTFDSKSLLLKKVLQYRVVNQLEDGTLVCVKDPLFHSLIFSKPKSKRRCVILGSESNPRIQRLDFVVEEDDFLSDDLFDPKSLSHEPLPIVYSPELQAIIAADLEKASLPARP
ncbi:MAG: hypothetical protein ACK57V_00255 [Pirellula sp.]